MTDAEARADDFDASTLGSKDSAARSGIEPASRRRLAGLLFGMACGALILFGAIILAPFAIVSAMREIVANGSAADSVTVGAVSPDAADFNVIDINLRKIDEVESVATLRISGFHGCQGSCKEQRERLLFSAFRTDATGATLPTVAAVDLPGSAQEVEKKIDLPIQGRPMFYPFDTYEMAIGVGVERVLDDGSHVYLDPAKDRGSLAISFDEDASRMAATTPVTLDPAAVSPRLAPYKYMSAFRITLHRPLYLQYTVLLLAGLVVIASLYTAFIHDFRQLVLGTGTIIFGLWGARTLLIGAFPPDVTVLDLCLAVTAILVLLCAAGRSVAHFRRSYDAARGVSRVAP